jgi:hypothetical protein
LSYADVVRKGTGTFKGDVRNKGSWRGIAANMAPDLAMTV